MSLSLFVNCDVRSKEQYGHEIWISSYRARHTVHTQGIQKKARPTLPWVEGSRLAVQNSFPNGLVDEVGRERQVQQQGSQRAEALAERSVEIAQAMVPLAGALARGGD